MTGDERTVLLEALEQQIWNLPAHELCAEGQVLVAQLIQGGLPLTALLAEFSDETLAVSFCKGFLARDCFTTLLVDRYSRYIARWLFRWGVRSYDQARDVLQEVYLVFYDRGLALFRPEENFRAYLRRAVYHLCVDKVWRARKFESLAEFSLVSSVADDPQQMLLYRETAERIDVALHRLPPLEQCVLQRTLAGMSADEIGQELGVKKPAVYRTLFRGRRRLEQFLSSAPEIPRSTKEPIPSLPKSRREPSHA